MGLIESFSVIWLLKNIPDAEEGIFLNKAGVVLQAVNRTAVRIKYVDCKKEGGRTFLICCIIQQGCQSMSQLFNC
jgi:hypothetical protein